MNKIIASIISLVFNAYTALGFSNFLIIYSQKDLIPNWLFLFLLSVLLPLVQIIIFYKFKLISDFDITNKKERPLFHLLGLIPWFFLLVISTTTFSKLFFAYELELIIIYALMSVISIYWKISGHMIFNSIFAFVSTFLFFNWYLVIFWSIVLPLIAISRVVLGKHTVKQVIAGTILGLSVSVLLHL